MHVVQERAGADRVRDTRRDRVPEVRKSGKADKASAMTPEEKLARIIARALGHNDDSGMHWERYVLPARLILKETTVTFRGTAIRSSR